MAALSLSVAYCAPKKPQDEQSKASELISQGKYNESIAMMDSAVRNNPQDKKSRLLLASAYAAQAGIFLTSYMPLADELVHASKSRDAQVANQANVLIYEQLKKGARTPEQRKLIEVAQALFMATARMNTVIRQFNAIPNVGSPQSLENLKTAIAILDGDEYIGGPALYRGLLRLVLIKDYFKSRLNLSYFSQCSVDFNILITQLTEIRGMIARVYNDLIFGMIEPGKKAQMIQAAERFDIDLDNTIDTIKTINMPGAMDLSFVYKQLGTKCEGKR